MGDTISLIFKIKSKDLDYSSIKRLLDKFNSSKQFKAIDSRLKDYSDLLESEWNRKHNVTYKPDPKIGVSLSPIKLYESMFARGKEELGRDIKSPNDYMLYTWGISIRAHGEGPFDRHLPKGFAFWVLWSPQAMLTDTHVETEEDRKQMCTNIERFIEAGKIIYDEIHPIVGYGDFGLSLEGAGTLWNFGNYVHWLNFFGPEKVKEIGKEKLLSAPVYKAEEMKDSGVFLWRTFGPRDWIAEGFTREKEVEIYNHLGFMKPLWMIDSKIDW